MTAGERKRLGPGDLTLTLFEALIYDEAPYAQLPPGVPRTVPKDAPVVLLEGQAGFSLRNIDFTLVYVKVLSSRGVGWVSRSLLWDEMP